ncbi:MAG TPA: hypothetical protein VGG25_29355, partial [Streptosporangiaceae bacterium]
MLNWLGMRATGSMYCNGGPVGWKISPCDGTDHTQGDNSGFGYLIKRLLRLARKPLYVSGIEFLERGQGWAWRSLR